MGKQNLLMIDKNNTQTYGRYLIQKNHASMKNVETMIHSAEHHKNIKSKSVELNDKLQG